MSQDTIFLSSPNPTLWLCLNYVYSSVFCLMILFLSEGDCKVKVGFFFSFHLIILYHLYQTKTPSFFFFISFTNKYNKRFFSSYFSPDQVKLWPVDLVTFFIWFHCLPLLPRNHWSYNSDFFLIHMIEKSTYWRILWAAPFIPQDVSLSLTLFVIILSGFHFYCL